MKYQIDVVSVGRFDVPAIEVFWMDFANLEKWETLEILMFVIRGGGKTYLLNTGVEMNSSFIRDFWYSLDNRIQLEIEKNPVQRLADMGIKPEDVDGIFITPLTAYAAGNLAAFPNAKIYMSRTGYIDFWAPKKYSLRLPKKIFISQPSLDHLGGDGYDKLVLLHDEEQETLPGIRSLFVGSHHRSSMAYLFDTEKGVVAVSDCFFKYPNIEEGKLLGISENLEEQLRALDILPKKSDIIIPLYDPDVLSRYPNGKIV